MVVIGVTIQLRYTYTPLSRLPTSSTHAFSLLDYGSKFVLCHLREFYFTQIDMTFIEVRL